MTIFSVLMKKFHLLSICINVSVNNCPYVSTILMKHYRLQYPWYALYKWYCDLNTCGQAGWAAGTGAAPVLALPTCKPAAAARNSHDPRHNQCALLSTGGPPPPSNRATTLKRSKRICSHLMRHRELLNFVGQFMNWPISIIYPYACKGLKRRSTRSNADGKHFINRLTLLPEERCWSVRVLCSSRLDVNL